MNDKAVESVGHLVTDVPQIIKGDTLAIRIDVQSVCYASLHRQIQMALLSL